MKTNKIPDDTQLFYRWALYNDTVKITKSGNSIFIEVKNMKRGKWKYDDCEFELHAGIIKLAYRPYYE